MKLKRTIIGIVLLAMGVNVYSQDLLSLAPTATKQVLGTDSIIAVVEDRVITREEVLKEVEPFIPQIKAESSSDFEFNGRLNAYVSEIVKNMVDREIIIREFNRKGMTIPESYLDNYFNDYLVKEFNGDRAELLKYVQSQGKTLKQFKEEQQKDIIVGYMQGQQRQTVSEVSPKKIIDYYNENKDKWYSPASVHVSQILLKNNASNVQENEKLAKEIVEKARAGMDFAKLAKEYSQDSNASAGGDWGWYKKGELSAILDEKAFALNIGEITDPITLGNMIFIIKVEDKKEDGIQSIDSVREQIEWNIVEQNNRATYLKWLEDLRKKAYIKYYQ